MYPQPFVSEDGVANVAIVYGSHPTTADLGSVTAISTDLGEYVLEDSVTEDPSVEGGDFVKLERGSSKFHLGNGILDVVSSTVNSDDLEELLEDNTYTDDDNDDFEYDQKLTLANLTLSMFDDNDYMEDTPTVGFSISSNTFIMNYTLDFSTDPLWADLAQTDLNIMGKDYFILSTTTNTTLNLLDSGVTTSVEEGEVATVTVGDEVYEVSAQVYSASNARLTINGERTNSLDVGETQKLSGTDTYIGVKSIDYDASDTGISVVEFAIGSGKLELTNGQDVQINDDSINGLTAYFTVGSEQLQKIVLQWTADDDLFVTEDSSITMPGFENVKMSYTGMTFPEEEIFTVQGGSSTYVQLNDFPLKDSTEDINLLYGTSGQFTGIGKDSTSKLRTSNSSSITFDADTDEYFVASYDDGTDAESYLVKATSFSTEDSVNRTTIQYKKDGDWTNKKENAEPDDSVTLGNVQLTIGAIDKNGKSVVITAGTNTNFNRLYSKEGLKVWLPWEWTSANYTLQGAGGRGAWQTNGSAQGYSITSGNVSYQLQFDEEDENENIGSGSKFNMTLGWNSDNEVQISDLVGESVTAAEIGDDNIFRTFMYSALATEFMWDQGSGSSEQDSVEVTYHGAESYANAFITDVSASVGGSSGSNAIGVPLKDTEIASASGKNIIVVGGSCVNTVAAELLGGTERFCGSEWTTATTLGENQFLIKTFSRTGGKIATLVAGWSAIDTQNAATALTTQDVDTTVGMAYTGSTADSITSM
jgi:hypothetical protein